MAYDPEFFKMYASYLTEPRVRENHDGIFELFDQPHRETIDLMDVLDLGCGMGEFRTYGHYRRYVGVDRVNHGFVDPFIEADYTDLSFLDRLPFAPEAFISLFSIEACLPAEERYAIYEGLFEGLPSVRMALVSGFYYESKKDRLKVGEAGDIESYQSVESLYGVESVLFDEVRIHMRTPSGMFGPDVVEVWKILTRR